MKIFEKIDVFDILTNHFSTLVNDNTKRPELTDWLTFLIIPVIIASALTYFKVELTERATNLVITTLSILVGLFFNVVVILFDIIKRDSSKNLKNRLLEQLLTNISYTIFTSLVIIFFTVLSFFDNNCWAMVMTFLVYFLLSHFAFTVLMILKRVYALFINEMDELSTTKKDDE